MRIERLLLSMVVVIELLLQYMESGRIPKSGAGFRFLLAIWPQVSDKTSRWNFRRVQTGGDAEWSMIPGHLSNMQHHTILNKAGSNTPAVPCIIARGLQPWISGIWEEFWMRDAGMASGAWPFPKTTVRSLLWISMRALSRSPGMPRDKRDERISRLSAEIFTIWIFRHRFLKVYSATVCGCLRVKTGSFRNFPVCLNPVAFYTSAVTARHGPCTGL